VTSPLETFRHNTNEWLEQHCPTSMRTRAAQNELFWGGRDAQFISEDQRQWFVAMREKGWLAPDWPKAYGGAGLAPEQCAILKEEMQALSCRQPLVGMGLWMIGPTLLQFGSEQQKQHFLPLISRGEIRWCQGYSEPGAGSDLANLHCQASIEGDQLVINGSKIWTSMADQSDWIFCLLRTGPQQPKHDGISFVLIDLATAGIATEPIRLISGNADFCQTFFDGARVPLNNVLGKLNEGWKVAKYLLQFERMAMAELETSFSSPKPSPVDVAAAYPGAGENRHLDPEFRDRISRHLMNKHAIALTQSRMEEQVQAGDVGSAMRTASVMKYVTTEEEKNKLQLNIDLMGSAGMGWEGEGFDEPELQACRDWLASYGLTIAGGTSEIQLNVIAKRILTLPMS
jgi:alkylation response protein AidB-like acyl-CoA dehydrogenase